MSEVIKAGTKNFVLYWPIIFRGALYFLAGFLPVFTEAISQDLKVGMWPSGPRTALALLAGTGAGVVIVRAYLDGSPQRHSDVVEEKKKQETAFFNKPAP